MTLSKILIQLNLLDCGMIRSIPNLAIIDIVEISIKISKTKRHVSRQDMSYSPNSGTESHLIS